MPIDRNRYRFVLILFVSPPASAFSKRPSEAARRGELLRRQMVVAGGGHRFGHFSRQPRLWPFGGIPQTY